jgi:hypothetical protein
MMFLIPLLIIFLLSICGGFLFSLILINIGIIDVPPQYGWLNALILTKRRFNKEATTYHERESVSVGPNYIVGVPISLGSGKSYAVATAIYNIFPRPLELIEVVSDILIAEGASIGSEYVTSGRCDVIVCGESEKKLLADVKLLNQGLSAVDSIPTPGGQLYEYKS